MENVSQVTETQNQGTETQSLGWRAGLPDDLKENDWAKQFGKVGDFFKDALNIKTQHAELNGKLEKAIFKPGEGAKEEEVKAFYKSLGVPDSKDAYELAKREGDDPRSLEWFKDTAFKANLTPDQAKMISESFNTFADAFIAENEKLEEVAAEKARTKATEGLKQKWGAEFDKNLEFTKRGWNKFTNSDFDKYAEETGIGNSPQLIEFIFNIGKVLGEDFTPKSVNSVDTSKKGEWTYPNSPPPPNNS
jgi:hypothetical protein